MFCRFPDIVPSCVSRYPYVLLPGPGGCRGPYCSTSCTVHSPTTSCSSLKPYVSGCPVLPSGAGSLGPPDSHYTRPWRHSPGKTVFVPWKRKTSDPTTIRYSNSNCYPHRLTLCTTGLHPVKEWRCEKSEERA